MKIDYSDSYRDDNVFNYYRNLDLYYCLQVGLGELELIPTWLAKNYPNLLMDIVEKDVNKKSKKFEVIYKDIFEFKPITKYNLIIFDIWYARPDNLYQQIEVLKTKFFPYLKKDGLMSFPMIDMHTVYSYVDLQKERDLIVRSDA